MCGILGFYDSNIPEEAGLVLTEELNKYLVHRGPDSSGSWSNGRGLFFGHQRLSILDLSGRGQQPIQSQNKNITLSFNGEIYNYNSLKRELTNAGYKFYSHCDSEVLVNSIEFWGIEESLKKISGMFAFAAWNERKGQLYLARDRMGEKPLYYGWNKKRFFFSSELKPLIKFPSNQLAINTQALSLFFQLSCIPQPYSIFEGIYKLEPGHYVEINLTKQEPIKATDYWKHKIEPGKIKDSYPTALKETKKLLQASIDEQLSSDVPLGAFLSGGIDSSLLVSLIKKSRHDLKTFSIGFNEASFDESSRAKEIAEHLGVEHFSKKLTGQEALQYIESMPSIYDEPFADSSQIATYAAMKLAREEVKVAICGDGGDEIFGGYNRHFQGEGIWSFIQKTPQAFQSLSSFALQRLSPTQWQKLYNSITPLLPSKYQSWDFGNKVYKVNKLLKAKSIEDFYSQLTSHWLSHDALKQSYCEAYNFDQHQAEPLPFKSHIMQLDSRFYLPNDILTKVDRSAMAVSLETRAPFLNHELMNYVNALDEDVKFYNGQSKALLRGLLQEHLPKFLTQQPKQGFAIPLKLWLNDELKDWAEELLSLRSLSATGLLNDKLILKRWQEHKTKKADWSLYLWDVLMFISWHNKWL